MITLNQTTGNNSEIVWVLKIHTDTPIYIGSKSISLDNEYIQALNTDIGDIYQVSTIEGGGGAGQTSSFTFNISRFLSDSSLDGFFNEFYPASGGVRLVSRIVDFGFCWEGASSDSEITWLMRGRITNYDYYPRYLNNVVLQESEIINKEVPYYSVQKDFSNGMSYFIKATSDNLGKTIPIIYGDFTKGGTISSAGLYEGYFALAPCIPTFPRASQFTVCSHACYETSEDEALLDNQEYLYKYLDGVKSYLYIKNTTSTDSETYNNIRGYSFRLTQSGNTLEGSLVIRLTEPSDQTEVDDVDNASDQDITSYSEIDAGETLGLKPIGSVGTDEVGFLGILTEHIGVYFRASTDGGGDRDYTANFYNSAIATSGSDTSSTLTSPTAEIAGHQFGDDTTGKINADLPWTIEEVCALDGTISNIEVTPGDKIRIYSAYLYLTNIKVQSINQARLVRNNGNGRG